MAVKYGSLGFAESIDFFRNKLNVPTERWNDIWRDNHNNSFMVAGAMQDDLLNDFRQAVDSAIAEGKSISWFQKEFNNIKQSHGWDHVGDATWRSNIIYNTNMRQSYNAGRYEQLQHFDYWEYQHGDSLQPRPLHLSWDSLLLPKDDPFWLTHFPSNGWGCKCKARGRSKQYVERKGLTVNKSPKIELVDWTDKATGEVHVIPKGIDPGFDYAPKKTERKKQLAKQAKKKEKPFVAPKRIAPHAFSTVQGADIHSLNAKLEEFEPIKDRVDLLSEFLHKKNIKTVLIKQAEMGKRSQASLKIEPDLEDYLDLGRFTRHYYTTANASRTNGFTWSNQDHVVVKVKSNTRFKKAELADLSQSVDDAILLLREDRQQWSLSHIVRNATKSGDNGGALVTWLHEVGHQVHFKAGLPRQPVPHDYGITQYGVYNEKEWHAEHFAMWVLNRDALAKWDESVAIYFDELIKKAIK